MKNMKTIVTGGAGFIGSHLVDKLLELGHIVTVIDDFSSGKEENLTQHNNNRKLTLYRKSICNSDLEGILKGIDVVFHLAAIPRVQISIKNPIETHNVNVDGTLNMLDACRRSDVKRFVFSSSAGVYGNQKKLPLVETMEPNPNSPYALHKLISEQYCRLFNALYGLKCISLRCFNVFGPKQSQEMGYASLIPEFIRLVNQGTSPPINGNGEQTRDFIFISDVVEAFVSAGTTKDKRCFGKVFNIGSGRRISINEVTESIIKLSGKSIQPVYCDSPIIEIRHSLADIAKAKELLAWNPKSSFEDGLKKTWNYYQGIESF